MANGPGDFLKMLLGKIGPDIEGARRVAGEVGQRHDSLQARRDSIHKTLYNDQGTPAAYAMKNTFNRLVDERPELDEKIGTITFPLGWFWSVPDDPESQRVIDSLQHALPEVRRFYATKEDLELTEAQRDQNQISGIVDMLTEVTRVDDALEAGQAAKTGIQQTVQGISDMTRPVTTSIQDLFRIGQHEFFDRTAQGTKNTTRARRAEDFAGRR